MNADIKNVRYTALFVDSPEKLLAVFPPKHPRLLAHHSTVWFSPADLGGLELGKKSMLKIIGRASDDKADVLLVENAKSRNKHPHITLSTAEGVASSYSHELIERAAKEGTAEMFDTPKYIEVTEGYADHENGVHVSPKPKLIVLAAGKGTRFYPLTKTIPKALVPLLDKTLIEYVLEPYLESVSDIIFVINPETGHLLREKLGSSYKSHSIEYVIQDDAAEPEKKGTWGALLKAKDLVINEPVFCVSNCDDLLLKEDIALAISSGVPSMGLANARMPWNYLSIDSDALGLVSGFRRHTKEEGDIINVCTSNGFYMLTPEVFAFAPMVIGGGEIGLPQTMLAHTKEYPLKAVLFSRWQAVNGPENMESAQRFAEEA